MPKVTVWINNSGVNSAVKVTYRTNAGDSLASFVVGAGATKQIDSLNVNNSREFSFRRLSNNTTSHKWCSLTDNTIINVKTLKFS